MKLADWMHKNGHTPATMRRLLGVKSRNTVRRWINGARAPEPPMIRRIEELTRGEVTAADFEDEKPAECAELIHLPGGRSMWIYPWELRDDRLDACIRSVRSVPREEDEYSPPVQQALKVLGGRAVPAKGGLFLVDGRQTDLRRVVAMANRMLIQWGRQPIRYPGVRGGELLSER
ncbi:MAG TPA: hypothetical protein VFF65_07470 [Phycisphaerales bacterium]|nr:hypothetical protein [Phycisphaerales bacterium]